MSTGTMLPDDDELVADLQHYFEATAVDEPPFRTRVADSVSVRRSSISRRRWLATGGVVAAVAAAVVIAVPVTSGLHNRPATTEGGGSVPLSPGTAFLPDLAAPQGSAGGSGTAARAVPGPTTAQGAQPAPQGAPPTTTKGSGAPIVVGSPNGKVERSVSASYTVPTGSFLSSFDNVVNRAVGMGGYVVSSQTSPDSDGQVVAGSVTVKVPSDKLADFVNGMPSTFTTSSIDFSSADHTAEYTDLSAQLASAQAQLTALNQLLAKATNLGDIISLEQQIAQVQSQVNSYQGQINVINSQVDLSTATVQLSERGTTPAPAPSPNPVKNGLSGGWSNAVAVTGAILGGVVTLLPLLVVALVVVAVVIGLRRRRA